MRHYTLALALTLLPAAAPAQSFTVPLEDAQRMATADARRRAWVLFGEGALSTAAGISLAVVDDDATRWAGVMTASFGAINLALAIPWLLSPAGDRLAPGETDLSTRLRRSRGAQRSAAVLALNAGLDVLYIAAGITAWALGVRDNDDRLRGGGIATLAQGTFLLAFDVWGWIASDANASRFVQQ